MPHYTAPEPHLTQTSLVCFSAATSVGATCRLSIRASSSQTRTYSAGEPIPDHFRDMLTTAPTPQAQIDHAMNVRFKNILESKAAPVYFKRRAQNQPQPEVVKVSPLAQCKKNWIRRELNSGPLPFTVCAIWSSL
ncbi:hypothetical protein IWZ03DRAFT_357217 [Phyllosticta citriasiana]|uniref:Uncharacterized protein n=1 Tax=Phyllosticta citriasiana TaxID=595635 RepID=A0ABR1KTV7_9PEZI